MRTASSHWKRIAIDTLQEAEHWLRARHGVEFRELRLIHKEDRVLALIKVLHREKHLVAFESGVDMASALTNLMVSLINKELSWKRDRYP